jgi:hypothetical protein
MLWKKNPGPSVAKKNRNDQNLNDQNKWKQNTQSKRQLTILKSTSFGTTGVIW